MSFCCVLAYRARLDEANLEPESSTLGAVSCAAAEAAKAEAEAAAAAAAAAQEQLFWMDAPLLLAELLWGLLRCAAVLPIAGPAATPQGQHSSQQDLLDRVRTLLEGAHGTFEAVLGVQCLVVPQDADSTIDDDLFEQQQQAAEQEQKQHGEAESSAGEELEDALCTGSDGIGADLGAAGELPADC